MTTISLKQTTSFIEVKVSGELAQLPLSLTLDQHLTRVKMIQCQSQE